MKEIKIWFSKLSPTMQIVVIVLAIITTYLAVKYAKNYFAEINRNIEGTVEEKILKGKGEKPSFSDSEYKSKADSLFDAMDCAGTNVDTVNSIFASLKNNLDFTKLDNAFNLRDSSCLWGDEAVSMSTWVRSEIAPSELDTINTMLSNKGIKKQI